MDSCCFGNASNDKWGNMAFDMDDDSHIFFTGEDFRHNVEEPSSEVKVVGGNLKFYRKEGLVRSIPRVLFEV